MEFRRVKYYILKLLFFYNILNLISDGEGNIYFNEILYGCMKKAYGID